MNQPGFTPTPQRASGIPGIYKNARLVWGFTLIEVMIYSFIITLFLGTVIVLAYSLISTENVLLYKIELAENLKFIKQKMSWALIGATKINSPAVGATGSSLSLERSDLGTLIFDLASSGIRLKTGSANPISITNGFVTVSSLSFTNYNLSSYSKNTIRVKGKLVDKNPVKAASISFDFFISIQ